MMARVQAKIIDVKTCPIHELTGLGDMFDRGYIEQNDADYRIESISIRSYPLVLYPALKTLIKQHKIIRSISYAERICLLFAISKLSENRLINEIIDLDSNLSTSSTCEDTWEELENSNRISYCTRHAQNKKNISSFYWVKKWIVSRSTTLGFNQRELAVFSIMYALSCYDFQNKAISKKVNEEKDHFFKYLNKRKALLKGITI